MVVPVSRLPSWLCHIDNKLNYKNWFEHHTHTSPFLSYFILFSPTLPSVFYFFFPLSLLSFFFIFSLSLPSSSSFSSLHSGLFSTLLFFLLFSSIVTAQIHPRSSLPTQNHIDVFSLSSFFSLFRLSSLPQIIIGKIIMAVNLSDSVILTVLLL